MVATTNETIQSDNNWVAIGGSLSSMFIANIHSYRIIQYAYADTQQQLPDIGYQHTNLSPPVPSPVGKQLWVRNNSGGPVVLVITEDLFNQDHNLRTIAIGYINGQSVFALRIVNGGRQIKVVRTVTNNGVTYTAGQHALAANGSLLTATQANWADMLTLTYGAPI